MSWSWMADVHDLARSEYPARGGEQERRSRKDPERIEAGTGGRGTSEKKD